VIKDAISDAWDGVLDALEMLGRATMAGILALTIATPFFAFLPPGGGRDIWQTQWAWSCAGVLGAVVGASELISRYTDAPGKAVRSMPAMFYIFLNECAGLIAFAVIHDSDMLGLASKSGDGATRVAIKSIVAGLGAMAIFRAAIFTVRIGNTDVSVGPAGVLQIIVKAVDRACDRDRAEPRARLAAQLMIGVDFKKACDVLPQFCFDSMQNVAAEETQRVAEWVNTLRSRTDIADEEKILLLGLRLLNIVGEQVLRSTIAGLGPRIQSPLRMDLKTMSLLRMVDFQRSSKSLPSVCRALVVAKTDDWSSRYLTARIKDIETLRFDNDIAVLLLASELIKVYGESVLASALEMGQGSFCASPPVGPAPVSMRPQSVGTSGEFSPAQRDAAE
jgi:hypothetical protein